jgi:8-oxo-dGTP pyrophosphatase MutT (NUDIX family)
MTETKIGRFMVGVGCLLEHTPTGKILCVRRDGSNFQKGEWEITYGRIDQHEELYEALRREAFEETGVTDFEIKRLLRVWHFYRGEKSSETEIFGFTFHCVTDKLDVQLSLEHSEYAWLTPEEALEKISVPGIKMDIELFIKHKNDKVLALSGVGQTLETIEYL